jgi:hypothetical protein
VGHSLNTTKSRAHNEGAKNKKAQMKTTRPSNHMLHQKKKKTKKSKPPFQQFACKKSVND